MRSAWLFTALALVLGVTSCHRAPGFAPQGAPDVALDFSHPPAHACDIYSESFGDFFCSNDELHLDNSGRRSVGDAGYTFEPTGLTDLMLQADMRSVNGSGSYGVQFRSPDENRAYAFLVRPTGDFRLVIYGDASLAVLLPWTPSAAIHKGTASNMLQALARGDEIVLFANGSQVASVQDDTLKAGGAGVIAADGGHAAVSKFNLWILP